MAYIKFVLTLVSIPVGILWLLCFRAAFWVFQIKELSNQIKLISWARCIYFSAVCKILRVNTSHFTSIKLSADPDLVISNHHSFLDIFVIGCTFKGWFLAKSEVKKWPLIGALASLGGVVFVDRESLESRIKTIFNLRKLSNHGGICLFPEGTTTSNFHPHIEHWNHGGFATLIKKRPVTVQTHAISYLEHEFHAWEGDKDFVRHLFEICKKDHVTVFLSSTEDQMDGLKIGETRQYSFRAYRQVTKLALANHKNFNEYQNLRDLRQLSYRTI